MGLMNGLTFGGINSLDYGIYISGEAVFNAPAREVEMLQIPGRNGDFVLDHGRFENIEVSYPAGTFGDDQTDFREKLSDFRNAILSQVGYQRLTDTYHPDEYRMGVYASGLEVAPVHYNTAGEFVLTFNCKPQRWLTSGETAIAVTSGDDITNPTLFDSDPLLAVKGYGNIAFNGYNIDIENAVMGETQVGEGVTTTAINASSVSRPYSRRFLKSLYNNGDAITLRGFDFLFQFAKPQVNNATTIDSYSSSQTDASFTTTLTKKSNTSVVYLELTSLCSSISFVAGTASTTTNAITVNYSGKVGGTTPFTASTTLTIDFEYDTSGTIYDWIRVIITPSGSTAVSPSKQFKTDGVYLDSSVSILGNPTYIDCDIGECYRVESDGSIVTLNSSIDLGSDLPRLGPGTNNFIYDNTITELKVTPRWWII